MTRRSAVGTPGLLARHLRSRVSTSVALAILVGLAVALAALVPRGLLILFDAELQHQLGALPAGTTDLYGTGTFGVLDTVAVTSAEQLFGDTDEVLAGVPGGVPRPLSDSLGDVSWVGILPPDLVNIPEPRVRVQPVLGLAVDLHWQERVTFAQGAAPGPWAGDRDVPLEIAISDDYAEQAGFELGDVLDYADAPLVVVGIYSVNDPDDPYWVHARELRSATVTRAPSSLTNVRGAAYIDPVSAAGLPTALQRAELRAWYPLVASTMTYDEIPELTDQLRRMATLGLYLPSGEALVFETSLPAALDRVTATVGTVSAVLALAASAPLGALLAVLSLGTRAVLDRRRPTLLLAASRGASSLQVRVSLLIEGLLVAIPAAAVALAAVVALLPVNVDATSVVVPALLALTVPALFAASSPRGTGERSDLGGLGGRRRWITELAVIGSAGLALFLLLRRGLVTTSGWGVDPLLAATPLLLALVVCVIVLRLYPLPLLALQRASRAGTSPVGLVGTTASIRANTAAFGSVLAMVVGVSSAVFSLVLASTVSVGLGTAAASATGADIRVEAPTLDDVAAVADLDGVRAVAGLDTVAGVEIVFGLDTPHVTVVFVDPAALHEVRPDIPLVSPGSVLVSQDIADRSQGETELDGHPVTVVGTVPSLALPQVSREWVLADVADRAAILGEEASYDALLISNDPGAGIAQTAAVVRTLVTDEQRPVDRSRVEVVDTESSIAAAADRPSIAGLTIALLGAAALSLLLCVLAVALGALGAAGSRARMLAVLRLVGMSPAQLRGVLAWELAPVTLTALLAGTGFGIGLAAAITALVDLRSVVGGTAVIAPAVPWALVAATAVLFALVVAATGAVTSVAARRLNASAAVKMGME